MRTECRESRPQRAWAPTLAMGVACVLIVAGWRMAAKAESPPGFRPAAAPVVAVTPGETGGLHPVVIRRPEGQPRVDTGLVDHTGPPALVTCGSCHTTREASAGTAHTEDLDEFHQGLVIAHGERTCLSCHDPSDMEALRLADGKRVEYADVLQLCAQCHGTQARDYAAGAHGGMTGYWDLQRGPRFRNVCTDCHDPHAPAFAVMLPAPRARDRFMPAPRGQEHTDE